ncbi:MAG: hypothetical protein LBS99_00370 [Clostridiales bacterium]|jgi:hypothetical protein|nr:hypothetical protein [Clostridiales bacterium]
MSGKAQWIWHNGDLEIMQLNRCLTSRYEREIFIPPFWCTDDFCKNVKFIKEFSLGAPERMFVTANGRFNVLLENTDLPAANNYIRGFDGYLDLKPGRYRMTVSVYNEAALPALFVEGRTVLSDASFQSTGNDFRICEVGCGGYFDRNYPPAAFRFNCERVDFTVTERTESALVLDCGRELVGKIKFGGAPGAGDIRLFYGESLPEAKDGENCELLDVIRLPERAETEIAKAFRYVQIVFPDGMTPVEPEIYSEFVPQPRTGYFRSSDSRLERIFETSLRTLALNTREFFIDGIKRDRWVWSGDAYQSYLMNYYSFFDLETTRRTITALAGKPPVKTYMNHIMEYSFYWIIGLYDYYMYTGDERFIRRVFGTALEIADFTENTRKNAGGLIEGKNGDWVFVDWANLDNRGEVAVEQIIYYKALETIVKLCRVLGIDGERYEKRRAELSVLLIEKLWDGERGVFYYSLRDGKPDKAIKKHPHIFALVYDILDGEKRAAVIKNVLLDPSAEKITTPYMRFYELDALCLAGMHDLVLDEIRDYWGVMLDEDASGFWETCDASQKGAEKYAMYGRKYGKSLCHAWGASPLYLLGRHFVGLEPAEAGYKSFRLTPVLSDLEFFEARLPVLEGDITVRMDGESLRVLSDGTDGVIRLDKKRYIPAVPADYEENGYLCFRVRGGEESYIALKLRGKTVRAPKNDECRS